MRKIFITTLTLTMILICSVQGHADLYSRGTDSLGNRLIYDSGRDITWYDYTKSSAPWHNQMNWADTLSVNFGGTVYDDWRLPITYDQDCFGFCFNTSELGHLYYTELGNPYLPVGPVKTGPFQNLDSVNYWSGTTYLSNADYGWFFYFDQGYVTLDTKSESYYALAVIDGDVSPHSIVPEPISSLLFLTGGILIAGRRYVTRKK